MYRCPGIDVLESKYLFIFINDLGRNLLGDDLAKDAVGVMRFDLVAHASVPIS
jgi:hypothetical protein